MNYLRPAVIALLALVALLILLAAGGTRPAYAANITVNTTDDELNADGDCSLREAITAANTDAAVDACSAGSGADTIEVPAGTYPLSIAGTGEDAAATGDLDITADLTINGAGAATTIIDGGALDRVFHVIGAITVEISGVTIRNGFVSGGSGGGISNGVGGTLTITDSTVSGNTAGGAGGGINNFGTVTLTNSTVSGNTAGTAGGGINNFGTVTLTNSTVSGNTASSGGGISNGVDGTLIMTNSTVSGNTASNGGGIFNNAILFAGGVVTLNNSTVSGNTANVRGGGIFNSGTLIMTNSTVSGNTASNGGGIFNDAGVVMPSQSSADASTSGGVILNSGTLTLDSSTVSGNTATGNGGGIYNFGTLTLTSSTVNGTNTAALGGGIHNDGTLTLDSSTVSGNTAGQFGGGILNTGTLTATDSTISNNVAVDGGGGIGNFGGGADGTVTLNNSTVSGNTAGCCGGSGGGMSNEDGATMTLTDSTVSGNTALGGSGGGISNSGTLTLTNSTVDGNSANATVGGGISNEDGATLTLTNSTVSGNAAACCSGISNRGTLTLTNSTVSGNTAILVGGGIWSTGTVTLKNTIVANNAGGDCFATISSAGHNLDSDGSCGLAGAGDISNTDPLLGPVADNGGPTQTHALLAGSPAIDAGSPDCPPPASDQRGVTRPVDGDSDSTATCDMGAYEAFGLSPSFSDAPPSHWAYAHIEALYNASVTAGCATDPLRYCPNDSVTRAEMAVFIVVALNEAPVDSPTGVFDDVPPSHFAAGFIERLAQLGVTAGCATDPLRYCPNDAVTRAQMAVFIIRALNEAPVTPTGVFDDVPPSHWAAGFIERLAQLGITAGCATNPLRYCPNSPVTRAQMAVFIVVAWNLPLPP